MMNNDQLVFLSYTKADRERVTEYYDYINSEGYEAWMDYKRLRAGQNWDFEIKRALNKAAIIILFVSNNSVTKRGYVQRETKMALDRLDEKLIDDIYLIPVLLDDDANIPEQLGGVQFTHASNGSCKKEIIESIQHQLSQAKQIRASNDSNSVVRWTRNVYRDSWNGIPGYEVEAEMIALSSAEYSNVGEISNIIEGYLLNDISLHRICVLEPSTESYNFGQHKQRRTNTYYAHCADPAVVGKIISIIYNISTYYAGATHPNMIFKVFNYLLEPLIALGDVKDLFLAAEHSLPVIQSIARSELIKPQGVIQGNEETEYTLNAEWVERGTQDWSDFANYVFRADGIEFLFDAYQVGSYAEGPQSVIVPYDKIHNLIKDIYVSALDKEYIKHRQIFDNE